MNVEFLCQANLKVGSYQAGILRGGVLDYEVYEGYIRIMDLHFT